MTGMCPLATGQLPRGSDQARSPYSHTSTRFTKEKPDGPIKRDTHIHTASHKIGRATA